MAQSTTVEGRTIGRYRVHRHLATGGMAEIYLADYDDRGQARPAVVKVILRERARDRKFVQMFLDEARVASTLLHPNIAQLYEVGRDGDTYFYAMEYVAGDNVRALIERSLRARMYMPLPVTLAIGTRVAAALHYAHERSSSSGQQLNAVHRDVTPANIMLGLDGAVKLLDFGIARADSRSAMTQSGVVKGKFAYMSPEQCLGQQVDRRTDVFALGIVLYEVSTQRRAFRAETDFDTMQRIIRGEVVPPTRIHATYPRELEAILLKALAIEPRDRYQTAAELGQALHGFQQAMGVVADEQAVATIAGQLFGGVAPAPQSTSPGAAVAPAPVAPAPGASLASMLAATVEPEPVARPAWSRPPVATSAPAAHPSTAMPPPMTTLVGTVPPPTAAMLAEATMASATSAAPVATSPMMAVPAPIRGRRPATGPARAVAATGPAFPSAEGSAPAFSPTPSVSVPAIIHAPAFASTPSVSVPAMIHAPALGTPAGMAQVTPDDDLAAEFARASAELDAVSDDELTSVELKATDLVPEYTGIENTGIELPAFAVAPAFPPLPLPVPTFAPPPAPAFARPLPGSAAPATPGTWPAPVALPTPVPMATPPAAPLDEPHPERDRLGLWLAIAAILAVGAVVAAVMVFSSLGM